MTLVQFNTRPEKIARSRHELKRQTKLTLSVVPHSHLPSIPYARSQASIPGPRRIHTLDAVWPSPTNAFRKEWGGGSTEAWRAAPHVHPVLASGQLGCQSGARPSSPLLGLTIPAFVQPAQAWRAAYWPNGPWKPEQLEPHQVFFQARPRALRRQSRMQREGVFIHPFVHSFLPWTNNIY